MKAPERPGAGLGATLSIHMTATYSNPVHADYFADPYVWEHAGEYFAIGTGPDEAEGSVVSSAHPTVFPLLRSTDLAHWREIGRALIRPDAALGEAFWAPEVVYHAGAWWLYYSVGHGDKAHHLRVAQSTAPEGPYADCGALTDVNECAFAIDPHAFRDDDGRWYLFHARDFLDQADARGEAVRAGTALVVSPLVDMTRLGAPAVAVARARCDWQRFAAERPMYGATFDWHTLEGPCVVKHDGRYYCLYSGGCWQTDAYGVDYVVAEHAMGPYIDDAPAEPRVLRTIPGRVLGPGHCSVVLGPDRQTRFIVYHAWGADMRARRMCIDPLHFTRAGLRSDGPTWGERPLSPLESSRAHHA